MFKKSFLEIFLNPPLLLKMEYIRMDLFLEVNFILPEVLWPVLMGREQFFEHFPQKHLYGVPLQDKYISANIKQNINKWKSKCRRQVLQRFVWWTRFISFRRGWGVALLFLRKEKLFSTQNKMETINVMQKILRKSNLV